MEQFGNWESQLDIDDEMKLLGKSVIYYALEELKKRRQFSPYGACMIGDTIQLVDSGPILINVADPNVLYPALIKNIEKDLSKYSHVAVVMNALAMTISGNIGRP